MPINLDLGGGGNEYQDQAEQAMRQAQAGKVGGVSPIAVVLDLLGIGRQVARPPKGKSSETGDLASQEAGPTVETTEVTDKKGNVLDVVEEAVNQAGTQTDVQRLPLAPLELDPPLPLMTTGQMVPRRIQSIDPNSAY